MPASDVLQLENADYLERLHALYARDPSSLDREWQAFFAGFEAGIAGQPRTAQAPPSRRAADSHGAAADHRLAEGVADLVHSYRELGHCNAKLDPLGHDRPPNPLLELREFGLSDADLDLAVTAASYLGPPAGSLGELIERLQATYCRTLGVEYMDITDKAQRQWLQERMEPTLNRPEFSADQSRRILELLAAADTFEKFLHAKFIGQKRFSIEGAMRSCRCSIR
jgi:2-oxoglutarate dehydrogenase E1 component